MRKCSLLFALASTFLWGSSSLYGDAQKLPVPRFVSIRAQETNLRMGPGEAYPVSWTFTAPNIPVEIVAEFENWRKIRDLEGTEGWVHQSLLSGNRHGIIQNDQAILRAKAEGNSMALARLEKGAFIRILKCDPAACKVNASGYKGWIDRGAFWGIYKDEVLK